MDNLRKIYGSSKEEIWKSLSQELQGTYEELIPHVRNRITAKIGEWTVVMDTHVIKTHHDKFEYIRLRAPYVNRDGFRFTVYRGSVFDQIAVLLGMQDVVVGHEEFDDQFIIQGNNDEKLKQLFNNESIRTLLKESPSVYLHVRNDDGYFHDDFPEGVDELFLLSEDAAKDVDSLKSFFELFSETLNTLCHIGSAYENDPHIKL